MGSFGAVWEAVSSDGSTSAVKEILCSSQADLLNALFEGHLLRSFTMPEETGNSKSQSRASPLSASRLPSLLGCETSQLGPDLWRVRLSMTCLPGQPLDAFLRQRQQDLKKSAVSLNSAGKALSEACSLARELMDQLVPAFEEHIAALAYHRDVNAHNILIDWIDGQRPRYSLVDFGLAVDVQCWHGDSQELASPAMRPSRVGQDGASTWHHLDVGGDCRYWPVSAWVQFLLGWTELESDQVLRSEYRTRLDMHSLGLTALQVLVETMPFVDGASSTPGPHPDGLESEAIKELWGLRHAWENYWTMVSPLHSRLMDTFHTGGDWDLLKADCLDDRVHEEMADHLRAIRASIIKTRSAARRCPPAENAAGFNGDALAGFLTSLLLLIGSGDSTLETEGIVGPSAVEVPGPVGWQQVRLALEEGARSGPEALSGPPTSGPSLRPQVGNPSGTSERHADLFLSPAWAPVRNNNTNTVLPTTEASTSSSAHASQAQDNGGHQKHAAHSRAKGTGKLDTVANSVHGDELMLHLGQLRERVDWLTQEMARLGEKREDGRRPVLNPGSGVSKGHGDG